MRKFSKLINLNYLMLISLIFYLSSCSKFYVYKYDAFISTNRDEVYMIKNNKSIEMYIPSYVNEVYFWNKAAGMTDQKLDSIGQEKYNKEIKIQYELNQFSDGSVSIGEIKKKSDSLRCKLPLQDTNTNCFGIDTYLFLDFYLINSHDLKGGRPSFGFFGKQVSDTICYMNSGIEIPGLVYQFTACKDRTCSNNEDCIMKDSIIMVVDRQNGIPLYVKYFYQKEFLPGIVEYSELKCLDKKEFRCRRKKLYKLLW